MQIIQLTLSMRAEGNIFKKLLISLILRGSKVILLLPHRFLLKPLNITLLYFIILDFEKIINFNNNYCLMYCIM